MANTAEISKALLKEMNTYYSNGAVTVFSLPTSVHVAAAASLHTIRDKFPLTNMRDFRPIFPILLSQQAITAAKEKANELTKNSFEELKSGMVASLEKFKQTRNVAEAKAEIHQCNLDFQQTTKEIGDTMESEFSNVIDTCPQQAEMVVSEANNTFVAIFSAVNEIGDYIKKVLDEINRIIGEIGRWITDTVTSIGNAIGNAISGIASAIGDWF